MSCGPGFCYILIKYFITLGYTAISKKVVLQKHKTLNSKRARDDGYLAISCLK